MGWFGTNRKVDLSQVCDGTEDCPPTEVGDGGEDEEGCYQEEGLEHDNQYSRKWFLGLWVVWFGTNTNSLSLTGVRYWGVFPPVSTSDRK